MGKSAVDNAEESTLEAVSRPICALRLIYWCPKYLALRARI